MIVFVSASFPSPHPVSFPSGPSPFFWPSCHPRMPVSFVCVHTCLCVCACASVHVRAPPEQLKCWCHSWKDRSGESEKKKEIPRSATLGLSASLQGRAVHLQSCSFLKLYTFFFVCVCVCVCLCLHLCIQAAVACVWVHAVWICVRWFDVCDCASGGAQTKSLCCWHEPSFSYLKLN